MGKKTEVTATAVDVRAQLRRFQFVSSWQTKKVSSLTEVVKDSRDTRLKSSGRKGEVTRLTTTVILEH